MFVRAITCIYHARFQPICQKLRRAGGAVTQHNNVGLQGFEIARSVLERFAFGQARSRCRDIDYVGAEAKFTKTRGEYRRCIKCANEWDVAPSPEAVAV